MIGTRTRQLAAASSLVALLAGLTTVGSPPASAQDPPTSEFSPEVTRQLDELVDRSLELGVTGMTLLIDVPGVGRYERSAGAADFGGTTPLPDDAHFRIGSITKTFTATVVLQLIEEGAGLALDDPISEYEHAWAPAVLPFQSEITVQQLLQHTSGIADFGASSTWGELTQDQATTFTSPELVDLAARLPVEPAPCAAPKPTNTQPSGTFCYSNTNFVLLGQIAEAVTGTPIGEEIRTRLLEPLGLADTRYPGTSLAIPSPATEGTGTVVDLDTLAVLERGPLDPGNPSAYGAAGSMVSDRHDVVRWLEALTEGEVLGAAAQLQRLGTLVDTDVGAGAFPGLPGADRAPFLDTTQYGLGIQKVGAFYGHNGEIDGWEAEALRDPVTGMQVVILQNASVFSGTDVDNQVVIADLTSFPSNLFFNILGIVPLAPPPPPPTPPPPPVPPGPPAPPSSPAAAVPARPQFTG